MEKTFHEALEDLKEAVIGVWKNIEEAIRDVAETIDDIDKQERYRENWYVPKNITRNHQVLNRRPMRSCIRNQL